MAKAALVVQMEDWVGMELQEVQVVYMVGAVAKETLLLVVSIHLAQAL
jgi:hypothetical protein